jgi:hypothetical protein
MAAPFFLAVKGNTSGTPGTGAYTPNTAPSGYRAWSTVPADWIGLVRYEDGTAWEITYSFWNGTTLSRASTQVVVSSTGSQLTLTSAALAGMVVDPAEVQPHLGGAQLRGCWALPNSTTTPTVIGLPAMTVTGTATASGALATTNFLTEQVRHRTDSATTANAQAGLSTTTPIAITSSSAGHGGWEYVVRFGASVLPTGPRLFTGMTATTFVANTGEPSALTANFAAFGKDSADTNIQLMVNSNVSTATKTDTGIAWAANGWYEATIWTDPGSTTVNALLIRLDTGAIWYGTTSTDVPANGALLFPQHIGGLSSTTGTAIQFQTSSITVRCGT